MIYSTLMDDIPTQKLKVVFFGTSSEYTMRPLQAVAKTHNVVAVVESAAKDSHELKLGLVEKCCEILVGIFGQPSLWSYARRRQLPYFYCSKWNLSQLVTFLQDAHADIGCIASFNYLFPETVIQALPRGIINFHPALLPQHRGPFVWFWVYHQMDQVGGATIHYIDRGEDTGDILQQGSFPIPFAMPPEVLIRTAIDLGAKLMVTALGAISNGTASRLPQSHLPCPKRARSLKSGEDLFPWQNWTIRQCYHFLQAASLWVIPFSKKLGLLASLPWHAVSYREIHLAEPWGKIRLDWRGFYFAHPQGKIYLRLPPHFLLFLLAAAAFLVFSYQSVFH